MLVSFMYWTHTCRTAWRPHQACPLTTHYLGSGSPKSPEIGEQSMLTSGQLGMGMEGQGYVSMPERAHKQGII